MQRLSIAVLAATLLATPAIAQTAAPVVNIAQMTMGYTYFNRPGADLAALDHDLAECMTLARDARSLDAMIGNGGIVGTMITGAAEKGVAASGTENCMVVRGWRVVQLPDAEGAALAALSLNDITRAMTPWIGAQTPQGTVVRVWGNDASRASTNRYAIRPAYADGRQLSLRIRTSDPTSTAAPPPGLAAKPPTLDPKWPKKPLKVAEIPGAPPESVVVVTHIRGISMRNGTGLLFARMGPDPDKSPSLTDHAPDLFNPATGAMFAKKEGNWFVFAVPPGRWRISAMGGLPAVDFCLGGPSFEAKAGEIVYAGSFDLGAEDTGPDLSLEAARTFLAGVPQAQQIRAAEYTNGARGQCFQSILYAFEIKGAPFQPGYTWGGAQKPPAAD